MMSLISIAVLVLAAIIILPILALSNSSQLRRRVHALEGELVALRQQIEKIPGFKSDSDPDEIAETDQVDTDGETDLSADEIIEQLIDDEKSVPTPQIALSETSDSDCISDRAEARSSMEETLGTKWTVWVGGLALALGGIFLVRYSIEAGLLGPAVRVTFGALFALALAAAGEYLRRRDTDADLAGIPSAYIPGILTAAAIIVGFATVYSAYALYGFLGPIPAFILLAACSFGALSASWLHGPSLAALGLIGSYATPALVSTQSPKAWPLFIYLAVVTGASFFAARLKGWLWLAASATAGAVFWGFLWCVTHWSYWDIVPLSAYILTLMALAAYFLTQTSESESDWQIGKSWSDLLKETDWVASGILAAISFLIFAAVRFEGYFTPSLFLLGAGTLALLASAWHWRNLSILVIWSALLFGAVYATWHIPELRAPTPAVAYLDHTLVPPPALWDFLSVGAVFGTGYLASGFAIGYWRSGHAVWTFVSATMPVLIFGYAYLRATNFEQSVPFGIIGLGLSAIYVGASDVMFRKSTDQIWGWRSGCYAAAAVAALALSFTILLEKGWLTIALAFICPGLGWVALKRPIPGLRYLAAGMAALVIARLVYDPVIAGANPGTTPIFNWLLYGYGIPAVAFVGAAWLFRRQQDDRCIQILEAAGILCTVILVGLQIRHILNDGNIYSTSLDLAEVSIQTIAMLGLAIGLQRIYDNTDRPVVSWAGFLLGIAGLAAVLLGLLFLWNPFLTGEPVGPRRIFNLLLLAYVVPAILCVFLYWVSQGRRPKEFVMAAGVAALLLVFAYISLENRALFHGSVLRGGVTGDAEWYAYSAIWMIFGAALLAAGILTRTAVLRYASLGVIILTVTKVFLSDLSHLSGILRALSFMGLGLVLVAIGYFYQRFVFPQARTNDDSEIRN